jgi:hypothetical protein
MIACLKDSWELLAKIPAGKRPKSAIANAENGSDDLNSNPTRGHLIGVSAIVYIVSFSTVRQLKKSFSECESGDIVAVAKGPP